MFDLDPNFRQPISGDPVKVTTLPVRKSKSLIKSEFGDSLVFKFTIPLVICSGIAHTQEEQYLTKFQLQRLFSDLTCCHCVEWRHYVIHVYKGMTPSQLWYSDLSKFIMDAPAAGSIYLSWPQLTSEGSQPKCKPWMSLRNNCAYEYQRHQRQSSQAPGMRAATGRQSALDPPWMTPTMTS